MKQTIAIVACAVSVGAQSKPADHVLDIVTYAMATRDESKVEPLPPGASGTSSGDLNAAREAGLVVSLESFDRDSYETGDLFVYEVLIENLGKTSIMLPWSPDDQVFGFSERKELVGFRQGSLSLHLSNRSGTRSLGWIESQGLFGSSDQPSSLRTLAPGDRARIRVPAYWRLADRELAAVMAEPGGHIEVSALFILDGYAPVKSKNQTEIVLKDRLRY